MSKQKPVLMKATPEMTFEELAEAVKRILVRNGITIVKEAEANPDDKEKGSNESIR
jgi:hypothetical protein